MRRPLWLWVWMTYTLVGLGTLLGCIPGIDQAQPIILIDPIAGGPGTSVAVRGSGFPAETQVNVRLGPPSAGATPQSYGESTTDIDGSFTLLFTMPAQWPDGTPITGTDLVVVVLNEDGSTKATAPFGYTLSASDASMPLPSTTEAHRQVILTWHREGGTNSSCDDVVVYASGYVEITPCTEGATPERRLLSANTAKRLHVWTETYQSFENEQTRGTGENRVLTRTTFVGDGSRVVSETELRMLQALLETLVPLQ